MTKRFKKISWAVAVASIFLLLSDAANGQQGKFKKLSRTPELESRTAVTTEEKLIRLAYKKLEVYSFSSNLQSGLNPREIIDGGKNLKFKLTNFKVGAIDALKKVRYKDAIDLPTEDVIQLVSQTFKLNDEQVGLGYRASWVPGQHAAMFDSNWSVGDILNLEIDKYYDVARYVSYDVTVSLNKRTRSYSSVVLLHGAADDFRFEFWDVITGMGGGVTQAWQESAVPWGLKRRDGTQKVQEGSDHFLKKVRAYIKDVDSKDGLFREPLTCPRDLLGPCTLDPVLANYWDIDVLDFDQGRSLQITDSTDDPPPTLADVDFYSQDDTGHISGTGVHHGRARFRSSCTTLADNRQSCNVEVRDQGYGDTEHSHTDFYYHRGTMADTSRGNEGPRGFRVECDAAVGFAFNACISPTCTVSITLSLSGSGMGVSATVSGGDLWRTARGQGNVCNIPREATATAGGCNEPATYGCLPGFVDVGGTCTRSLSFASQCSRFGEYDFASCSCTGGCGDDGSCSPIVVDVLGNGFSLTNSANGVLFDMEGKGIADRFAWTAENSDDAWLAMDRNNNGAIDSGKELFGNVTPQDIHADGVERNGFLALALYDSAAYGGNGDGVISEADAIFTRLRLWKDENHNGVSESCELFALRDMGLEKIDLDYRSSKRVDENGNEFRYRSKVRDSSHSDINRWAWDVFLVKEP